jgi:hypothetical protein
MSAEPEYVVRRFGGVTSIALSRLKKLLNLVEGELGGLLRTVFRRGCGR